MLRMMQGERVRVADKRKSRLYAEFAGWLIFAIWRAPDAMSSKNFTAGDDFQNGFTTTETTITIISAVGISLTIL